MTNFEYLKGKCLQCGADLTYDIYGLHRDCFQRVFQIPDYQTNKKITAVARLPTTSRAGSAVEERDDSVRDAQFHGNYPKYAITIAGTHYIGAVRRSERIS